MSDRPGREKGDLLVDCHTFPLLTSPRSWLNKELRRPGRPIFSATGQYMPEHRNEEEILRYAILDLPALSSPVHQYVAIRRSS